MHYLLIVSCFSLHCPFALLFVSLFRFLSSFPIPFLVLYPFLFDPSSSDGQVNGKKRKGGRMHGMAENKCNYLRLQSMCLRWIAHKNLWEKKFYSQWGFHGFSEIADLAKWCGSFVVPAWFLTRIYTITRYFSASPPPSCWPRQTAEVHWGSGPAQRKCQGHWCVAFWRRKWRCHR